MKDSMAMRLLLVRDPVRSGCNVRRDDRRRRRCRQVGDPPAPDPPRCRSVSAPHTSSTTSAVTQSLNRPTARLLVASDGAFRLNTATETTSANREPLLCHLISPPRLV